MALKPKLKKTVAVTKAIKPTAHEKLIKPFRSNPDGSLPHEWKPKFLSALAVSSTPRRACEESGISIRQAYHLKDSDPKFAEDWNEAVRLGIMFMEDKLKTMALNESNITAVIFWLKAHDSKYRERVHFEIANKIVESVTLEIITILRNTIPDTCPNCGHLLALGPKISAKLKELSQGLLEKPETVKGDSIG